MNPYDVLANPLRPTFQPDVRSIANDGAIDRAVSNAAYHLVRTVDQLLFKRGR